jgi:hypothetical protein
MRLKNRPLPLETFIMDFAQDLLTLLMAAFELGVILWLSFSFILFVAQQDTTMPATPPVLDADLPSLPELFALTDALAIDEPSEPPLEIVESILQPEPASHPKQTMTESAIDSQPKRTIRSLKQLAKDAHIPNYGRMTKLQLLQALHLT